VGKRSKDARAVVTGAGSGIGRAFALELAKRGGQVVCADLDLASAKETVVRIESSGGDALPALCDVSVEDDVRELAATASEWFGRPPDLVVNNAGIGAGGRNVGDATMEEWQRTLGVNLWGVIHGCHHFVPPMREAGYGGIVNVASAAGFAAAPRMAAYNVSKAGVMSLSETLAAELSGTGVNVTVLCPTGVRTNIVANTDLIDPGAVRLANLLIRFGFSPERVARTTLDALDKGRLYVVPQPDAQLIWATKRLLPTPYTRMAGLFNRIAPME